MTSYVIEASKIKKTFYSPAPVEILKGVDLNISSCETVAIVGPSGSGKSTLLQILGSLEAKTSGTLKFFEQLIEKTSLSELRSKKIGFVFQSGNLLEEETLLNNLLIKAKIARRNTNKQSPAFVEAINLIERVGLSHRLSFSVKHLSGGEKQRAAIARALMNDPSIILADEPTGNLDAVSAKNVQNLLIECCKKFKKSLVVVTHDLDFANLCDRQFSLIDGLLIEGVVFDQHISHR